MPEATVLYSVTALVIVGLVVWAFAVLRTAKDPWARAMVPLAAAPVTAAADAAPPVDADDTARATPVALASDPKAKSAAAEAKTSGDSS